MLHSNVQHFLFTMQILRNLFVGFLLAVLGAVIVYLLYALAIDVGWMLIFAERFRPKGWNSQTIAGVARLAILVLGSVYIMYFASIGYRLRVWHESGNFNQLAKQRIIRLITICLVLGVIFLGLNYAA